jgi:predicted methyltransferase
MLEAIEKKKEQTGQQNITCILGSITDTRLPANSVDKVLLVDVYHEFDHPAEMMASITAALRPGGELFLIEYRAEDDWVPIKKVHKMSEAQAVKEMEAAGLKLKRNIGNLPWQHCMVFIK